MGDSDSPPDERAPPDQGVAEGGGLPGTIVSRSGWRRRLWLRCRPTFRQAWLNIRAWIPFLMNPFERKRLVRYTAREDRKGLTWTVDLPARCSKCNSEDDLRIHRWGCHIRSFEYPISVIAGTLAGMLAIGLCQCALGIWLTAGLSLAIAALGTTVLFLKSWRERVELVLWTCPMHEAEFQPPEVVVFDEELYLYLPTAGLAKAAAAEQKDRRTGAGRWRSGQIPEA